MSESEIGKPGRAAERKSAKRLGAKTRRGSGCGETFKGDFEAGPEFLVEHKSTTRLTLPIQHGWLAKIMREAQAVNRCPALHLAWTRGDGEPLPAGSWVAIPEWRFKEMIGDGE